jgi:hypothetical protein
VIQLLSSVTSLPEHRGLLILGAGLIGLALVLRRLISAFRQSVDAKASYVADGNRVGTVVRAPGPIDSVSNI